MGCPPGEACLGVPPLALAFCVRTVDDDQAGGAAVTPDVAACEGEDAVESAAADDGGAEDGEMVEDAVCVDAALLRDALPLHPRVFQRDVRAEVLCDVHGTCATAGHMMVWRGEGLMMWRYCESVEGGCVRMVREVNSPRWAWGLRVRTRSPDLWAAAVAARWGTVWEEAVLGVVLRVGG